MLIYTNQYKYSLDEYYIITLESDFHKSFVHFTYFSVITRYFSSNNAHLYVDL